MKISRYYFLMLLVLVAFLTACNQQSVLPEESASAFSKPEPTSAKRIFKPYMGDRWIGNAISYGCYRQGQAPGVKGPSESELLEDLNIIKEHWNLIRLYGSDPDTERILEVIHSQNLPIKVMLGMWLENETQHPERKPENLEQVTKGITLANRYPDIVIAVNVGNETQVYWSWHRMEPSTLVKYIRQVRGEIAQPVTTADDYNFWNKPESQAIAAEIDFIVLHAYALANKQQLEHAVTWTDSVYKDTQQRHPGMTIVQGETGWATVYDPTKVGPGQQGTIMLGDISVDSQERFLVEINQWIDENRITTFYFEAFDESWKGGGELSGPDEVEKHWGIYHEDRTAKQSLKNYLMLKKL